MSARAVKRSCRTCGWSGTYTSSAKGDAAKRAHSCEKHLRRAAATARREAREAQVDRAPKACLHKVAQHEHGTRAAYVLDRCRCIPCSKANSREELNRERQKAYGRYDKYVDAEPIRDHLAALREYGIGIKRVALLSGVSTGSLTKILYGTYASIDGPSKGRYGKGDLKRGPSKRVLRTTANRLLSIKPVPENIPAACADPHRTPQARTYLRALVALGWSQAKVGARLGMTPASLGTIIHGNSAMSRGTVDAVLGLYSELSMTLPPAGNQRERISVSRSRRYAKERGWLTPLDLEAEGIEVDKAPYLDEAAIQRRLDGDRGVELSVPERREMVSRLHRWGLSVVAMVQRTGYPNATLNTDHRVLGLAPNPLETRAPIPATGGNSRKRAA